MKLVCVLAVLSAVGAVAENDKARFTKAGELIRPAQYREWIFLSSGLGMTYGPNAPAPGSSLRFDNVYVNPSSYRHFVQTGKWPEGTVLVLEIRESESKGSINQHGHFQGSVVAVEANVKDSKRFPQHGWGFFDLGADAGAEGASVKPIAPGNGCEKCHSTNGAVDGTFVQFYPDLIAIAKRFGTFRTNAPIPAGH